LERGEHPQRRRPDVQRAAQTATAETQRTYVATGRSARVDLRFDGLHLETGHVATAT
jgi:hypothetical protein